MKQTRMATMETSSTPSPSECLGASPEAPLSQLLAAFVQSACAPCGKHSFQMLIAAFETMADEKAREAFVDATPVPGFQLEKLVSKPLTPCQAEAAATSSKRFFPVIKRQSAQLRRLSTLLRRLPPRLRRQAIAEGMSQALRLSLERWMLAERSRKARPSCFAFGFARAKRHLSERSLCRLQARCGRIGYRPVMHLAGGLYAQASFSFDFGKSVSALGMLAAMRSFCRILWTLHGCDGSGRQPAEMLALQAKTLRLAVRAALAYCGWAASAGTRQRFSFKTRVRLSRSPNDISQCLDGHREACSPACTDLDAALKDWQLLAGGTEPILQPCQRQAAIMGTSADEVKGKTKKLSRFSSSRTHCRRSRIDSIVAQHFRRSKDKDATVLKKLGGLLQLLEVQTEQGNLGPPRANCSVSSLQSSGFNTVARKRRHNDRDSLLRKKAVTVHDPWSNLHPKVGSRISTPLEAFGIETRFRQTRKLERASPNPVPR